jgi:alanine or glycine:cation symporter, AGCS family
MLISTTAHCWQLRGILMHRKIGLVVTFLLFSIFSNTSALAQGLDEAVDKAVQPLAEWVAAVVFFTVPVGSADLPLVVLWLVAGATFFTFYLGFINLRGFKHAIEIARGQYADPEHPGEVSHFQALATAVSGTVGIGNIGGVAIAVTIGGAGATFWLIVAGFLGMSTKFVECTLGVKYRRDNDDGSVSGGPMYYLERGFADQGMKGFGQFMGIFYAIGIFIGALGIGNMFQSNQAFEQFVTVTGGTELSWFADKGWLFGLVMAVVVGLVIIGGIKSIARVTEKIVPFMALFYCFFAGVVILMNLPYIPAALGAILEGAFTGEGVAGGALGAMIIGFQRAVFSNEAGIGSASIAHSAVRTDEPITEGMVSLLEPFIDTIVICTLTALVIGTSAVADPDFANGSTGIVMTSAAFARQFSWFPIPLAFAAMLFAFSTMISWAYYGLKGWTYLFGHNRVFDRVYMLVFCFFIVIGAMLNMGAIISISDAIVFVICVPNILGLYFLAPIVKREMKSYMARVASGEIKKFVGGK